MHMRNEVVVIDDDKAVREALQFSLELQGLKVHTCDSAQSALAYPGLQEASCLVVDYKMPEMDGFDLCHRLASKGRRPPVIIITAPLTQELKRRAEALGVFCILEKPLLDDMLGPTVRAAMA
jgi:FixJ family two-component response regulator